MTPAKEEIKNFIETLPNDFSYDQILREFAFRRMVARGLDDVHAGRTITDQEMKREIESWQKSK